MDWKETLAKVAPTVATILGGPFAGVATQALASALGADPASVQKIVESGQMTGEQLAAIRKAELDLQGQLEAQGVQLEQIAANDRDSARKREEVVKDATPRYLAYLVTLGFFGLLAFLATNALPKGSEGILDVMVGSLGTSWVGIVTYYFGSSAGSERKTDLIAARAKK